MVAGDSLVRSVFSDRNRLVELLRDLIRIDSSNPPGDTRELAGFVADWLTAAGVSCDMPAADDLRPGVLVTLNPGGQPNLLYHSHLDTAAVGDPEAWQVDPFGAEAKGGRIYGLGASDAKSALAGMMVAVARLAAAENSFSGSLTFNAVADEETGGELGMAHIVREKLIDPDLAVVGESTGCRIATAERGMIWLEIIVTGRSAHASVPGEGINAISKMVRFLAWLEEELAVRFRRRRHPLTPPPTLNVGVIEGGARANVVPDRCRVVLDRRVLPTETIEGATAELEELLAEMNRRDPEFNGKLFVQSAQGLPFETDPDHPLVTATMEAGRWLGMNPEPVGYLQASDGRILTELGVPTVIIGPGKPEVAHRPNEYVVVDDVVRCAALYALLALRVLA